MLAPCPGRCLLHHKGIENDQTISGVAKGGRSTPGGTFKGAALWAINLQRLY